MAGDSADSNCDSDSENGHVTNVARSGKSRKTQSVLSAFRRKTEVGGNSVSRRSQTAQKSTFSRQSMQSYQNQEQALDDLSAKIEERLGTRSSSTGLLSSISLKRRRWSSNIESSKCHLNSAWLQLGVWMLVWLDVVLLLYRAENRLDGNISVVALLQIALLVIFLVELVAQFCFGAHPLNSYKIRWLWFDAVLVLSSALCLCIYGINANVATLPRMLRVFRIFYSGKYHTWHKPLLILFGTIQHCLGFFLYGLVMIALTVLFFAIVGMEVLQVQIEQAMGPAAVERFGKQTVEDCRHAFSSLLSSTSTLLVLQAGDSWHHVAYPIIQEVPSSLFFFVTYFLVVTVVIAGSIFSAIYRAQSSWESSNQWLHKAEKDKLRKGLIKQMLEAFAIMDTDNNGVLSFQEFYHNRSCNEHLIQMMETYGLDEDDLDTIWGILDNDQSGSVDQQEFLDVMLHLYSGEDKFLTMKAGHLTAAVYHRVDTLQTQIETSFQHLMEETAAQRDAIAACLEIIAEREMAQLDGNHADSSTRAQGPLVSNDISSRNTEDDQSKEEVAETGKESMGEVSQSLGKKSQTLVANILSKSQSPAPFVSGVLAVARTPSQLMRNEDLALSHMRFVSADRIAKYGRSDVVHDFWSCQSFAKGGVEKAFHMSSPCKRCDFFISHCWSPPNDWYSYFNKASMYETYEYKKTLELYSLLDNFLQTRKQNDKRGSLVSKSFADISVWIDKACIPQADVQAKAVCVSLIEEFIKLSNGFIVLLSWHYFSRLWCVYEWACFLRLHHPRDAVVSIGCDAFLRTHPNETLPMFIQSIENLSVKGAQCYCPDDKAILKEKVFQYYNGNTYEEAFDNFERFAKSTATIHVAQQLLLWRACKSKADETAWLGPLRDLAQRLGDNRLCRVLAAAKPAQWYAQCDKNREVLKELLHYWFESAVVPYLLRLQQKAVRPEHLSHSSVKDIKAIDPSFSGPSEENIKTMDTQSSGQREDDSVPAQNLDTISIEEQFTRGLSQDQLDDLGQAETDEGSEGPRLEEDTAEDSGRGGQALLTHVAPEMDALNSSSRHTLEPRNDTISRARERDTVTDLLQSYHSSNEQCIVMFNLLNEIVGTPRRQLSLDEERPDQIESTSFQNGMAASEAQEPSNSMPERRELQDVLPERRSLIGSQTGQFRARAQL